jgi:hypothetical protein
VLAQLRGLTEDAVRLASRDAALAAIPRLASMPAA